VAAASKKIAAVEEKFDRRRGAGAMAKIKAPRAGASRVFVRAAEIEAREKPLRFFGLPGARERLAESVVSSAIRQMHAQLASGEDISIRALRRSRNFHDAIGSRVPRFRGCRVSGLQLEVAVETGKLLQLFGERCGIRLGRSDGRKRGRDERNRRLLHAEVVEFDAGECAG